MNSSEIYIDSLLKVTPTFNSIWCLSLAAAGTIGLTGVIPILFMSSISHDDKDANNRLKLLLSFSVGGLLGDVFLHLLPEAWAYVMRSGSLIENYLSLGLWVVSGISTFLAIEMIFTLCGSNSDDQTNAGEIKADELDDNSEVNSLVVEKKWVSPSVTGYLSVFANGVDNFTHGLAIAASFSAGVKIGVLTTIAILIHEVPHEFGDFAILMKSGFSRWKAIQAQMFTAAVAMIGAAVALLAQSSETEVGSRTRWILPYSAGCFLYIAMSNILPGLLKEDNPKESLKQLVGITMGVLIMALVNMIDDDSLSLFM